MNPSDFGSFPLNYQAFVGQNFLLSTQKMSKSTRWTDADFGKGIQGSHVMYIQMEFVNFFWSNDLSTIWYWWVQWTFCEGWLSSGLGCGHNNKWLFCLFLFEMRLFSLLDWVVITHMDQKPKKKKKNYITYKRSNLWDTKKQTASTVSLTVALREVNYKITTAISLSSRKRQKPKRMKSWIQRVTASTALTKQDCV